MLIQKGHPILQTPNPGAGTSVAVLGARRHNASSCPTPEPPWPHRPPPTVTCAPPKYAGYSLAKTTGIRWKSLAISILLWNSKTWTTAGCMPDTNIEVSQQQTPFIQPGQAASKAVLQLGFGFEIPSFCLNTRSSICNFCMRTSMCTAPFPLVPSSSICER